MIKFDDINIEDEVVLGDGVAEDCSGFPVKVIGKDGRNRLYLEFPEENFRFNRLTATHHCVTSGIVSKKYIGVRHAHTPMGYVVEHRPAKAKLSSSNFKGDDMRFFDNSDRDPPRPAESPWEWL